MQLRLHVADDALQQVADHLVLVGGDALVHRVDLGARLLVDLGGDVVARAHVLLLVLAKGALAFCSESLDLGGGFLLGLLQSAVLPLARLANLFGGALLRGQQLLDALRLAGHLALDSIRRRRP